MKLYIPQPIRNFKSSILNNNDYNDWFKVHNVIDRNSNDSYDNKVNYIIIDSPYSLNNLSLFKDKTIVQNNKINKYNNEKIKSPILNSPELYKHYKRKSKEILNNNELLNELKKQKILKKGIDIIINKNIIKTNSEKITFKEKNNYKNLLNISKYSRLNHIYYLSNEFKKHLFIICKKKANKYINYAYIKEWNDNFPCHIIKLKYFYAFSFSELKTFWFNFK